MKTIFSMLLFAFLFNLTACNSQPRNGQTTAGQASATINQTISVDDFEKKLAATPGAQLIDVRTPAEYAKGHLKNAVNININSDDFEKQIGNLDKKKPVLVYCLSGGRSGNAASKMEDMGFAEVYNMNGGVMKWENAGKPLEQGAAASTAPGITQDEFNKMITANKYVLVDYNAQWCAPCKKMLPGLESLAAAKKDKLSLLKIDADGNKDLLKQKGISGIPYLELYLDGKLVWKHDGYIEPEELVKETKL